MKVTSSSLNTVILTAEEVDCMIREYLERRGFGSLLTSGIDDCTLDLNSLDAALKIYLSSPTTTIER